MCNSTYGDQLYSPLFYDQPAKVHVKLSPRNPNGQHTPCKKKECRRRLESIFKEWIRNAKLFGMEKKMIKEGKQPTINDLPDIPLVPLEIVIEPDSVFVLEHIEFWGPGVKDIRDFDKGCEKKEDLCWGDIYDHRGLAFFHSAANVSYVDIEKGYGVGVKEHRKLWPVATKKTTISLTNHDIECHKRYDTGGVPGSFIASLVFLPVIIPVPTRTIMLPAFNAASKSLDISMLRSNLPVTPTPN
ncbi:hypothetical protein HHX47_DHR6000544 [Lentinula edodes]|nr:hypothetical protein HHX47_DHR6000544 [Lentinula edodes]